MRTIILTNKPEDVRSGAVLPGTFYTVDSVNATFPKLYGSAESVVVCVEFGHIISDIDIESMQRMGARVFNIHRGDPEEYRGASVLNHQILDGVSNVHVSLIELKPGEPVDGGDVIYQVPVRIKGATYTEAVERCRNCYCSLIREAMAERRRGLTTPPKRGKLYKRREPKNSFIGSEMTIWAMRTILAADPVDYPAYFDLDGYRFYLQISSKELIKDGHLF